MFPEITFFYDLKKRFCRYTLNTTEKRDISFTYETEHFIVLKIKIYATLAYRMSN